MIVAYLIHVANVLYLVSYLVRDILWLRVLTVVAIATLCPYFYFRDDPLWAALAWNVVFFSINAYQIKVLLMERRPVTLSEREQRLYHMLFRTLTPREFLKLLKLARWQEATEERRLLSQGDAVSDVVVIFEGKADVSVDGKRVATLDEGSLIGEIAFLTGAESSADVTAAQATHYVSWPMGDLKVFLKEHPDLRAAWQMVVGTDLALKLRAS